ncbi:MAG: hypothetical protein E6K64_06535 [Nitrospirae bacterium]|nr:MAG: hypothetical protein E6K64_06535 [Nitrospirota bacterium]
MKTMKRCLSPFLMVLSGLFVVGVWTPSEVAAWNCDGYNLLRLSAEFREFDGNEAFTDVTAPPGSNLYHKIINVPDGCDTLYVTISAVADTDFETALWLTCKVDGSFCNPGSTFATDTPGWISVQVQNQVGREEDNGFYYTWCTQITPGTHFVEIRFASGTSGNSVYVEAEHYYIDASNTVGGCVLAAPPDDPSLIIPRSLKKLIPITPPQLPLVPSALTAPAPAVPLPPMPKLP